MTIGGSIALFVIGAVLRFAVTVDVQGINLDVVGIIMMIGGVVGFIVGLLLLQRQRGGRSARPVEGPGDDPGVY